MESIYKLLRLRYWALYSRVVATQVLFGIYINLPINAIVRLPHPRSGDSQRQDTFLYPSADKQTSIYDTAVLKPPSLPINPKVNGIEP